MNHFTETLRATIEAMSVFQLLGGTIFLLMTVVFFLWILYLGVTR